MWSVTSFSISAVCSFMSWWRHQMETFSALLALCAGNSPHKGQGRGALVFSLFCAWINGWVNNREAGDLIRHSAHYDVTVIYVPKMLQQMFTGKRGVIPLPIHKSGGDYQPVLYSLSLGEEYIRHWVGYHWFGDKPFTESEKPIAERIMMEFTGSSLCATRSQCFSVIYLQILIKPSIFLYFIAITDVLILMTVWQPSRRSGPSGVGLQ